MSDYTFWIPITGTGDNTLEAWQDAMERVIEAISKGQYSQPPEDLIKGDRLISGDLNIPIPDFLGGSLSAGFGIDHGPEE